MSISVHDALLLPAMNEAKLVAGRNGIHQLIQWVTIVEVIEDVSRLQEGEFLITTGYGLKENNPEFINLLSKQRLSGIVIYTGLYLEKIPFSYIEMADQVNLPLIEIPKSVNFSTITKGILEEMINKQLHMISSSLEIHKQLTQLVLENKGYQSITETLGTAISSSIFIVGKDFELMNTHNYHEDVFHPFENFLEHFMPYIKSCFQKHKTESCYFLGFQVVFYPIVANQQCFGSIIACKESERWGEFDKTALEHAATVFAIEAMKQEDIQQTKARMEEDFLEEVLHHNFKSSSMAMARGKKLGFDLSLPHCAYHFHVDHFQGMETVEKEFTHDLYLFILHYFKKQNRQFMVRERLNGILLLVEMPFENSKDDSLSFIDKLIKASKKNENIDTFYVGVGRVYQHVDDLRQSALEAKSAVELRDLLLHKKNVIHYDDLHPFHLLLQMVDMGMELKNLYTPYLKGIINESIDLIGTIEAYLSNHLNAQLTAKSLFIHRHTLTYRLQKVEEKTGLSLKSADDRLKLQMAVAAYKLDSKVTGSRLPYL